MPNFIHYTDLGHVKKLPVVSRDQDATTEAVSELLEAGYTSHSPKNSLRGIYNLGYFIIPILIV